jgi:hypothetical protein
MCGCDDHDEAVAETCKVIIKGYADSPVRIYTLRAACTERRRREIPAPQGDRELSGISNYALPGAIKTISLWRGSPARHSWHTDTAAEERAADSDPGAPLGLALFRGCSWKDELGGMPREC